MKKRFNLYYLFAEEQEQRNLSKEKDKKIRKMIDAYFQTQKKNHPALPTDKKEG